MAEQSKPHRERYAPGAPIYLLGTGVRIVKSAQFDDDGQCVEWTDTTGETHQPWLSA